MRKISRIEPKLPDIQARKKVAAYACVSRDTEWLMHSVSAQVSYYSTLIKKNPEWEGATRSRIINCWSSATLSIWGNPTTICVNGNVQVGSLWDNMGNLTA